MAGTISKKRVAAQEFADIVPNKKRKFDAQVNGNQTAMLSVSELSNLLAFSQNTGDAVRNNIRRFRQFIENIEQRKAGDDVTKKLATLQEYLQTVVSLSDDPKAPVLSDMLQTWSFAAFNGNKALFTTMTSTLAILLRVISTEISFRRIGTSICQALLSEESVKILKECLFANRNQEQLLSASLRLLTEVVSFDGGVCAKSVWKQREILFKRLDELLGARAGSDENKRGPMTSGLRLNALRFLLANLRVQDAAVKSDILLDPRRIRAVFQNLNDDSAATVVLTLQTLESHVLGDLNVNRQTKGRVLTESTLAKVASLYAHPGFLDDSSHRTEVREVVHTFLIKSCCNSDTGVLLSSEGWSRKPQKEVQSSESRSGARFPARYPAKSSDDGRISIANNKLSNFIQDLRPHANLHHRELVLAIFKAAPELVADYFFRKRSFSFDPKLTSTWIGFSSFVLAMTQIPVPDFDASKSLPSVLVVLENILPSSLSKKSLTRCFNQSSALIRLLTAKVLVSACRKLSKALRTAEEQAGSAPDFELWRSNVLSGFTERCPDVQSITTALRACTDDQNLLKESLLSTISAVSKVSPRTVAQANFDVSLPLTDALGEEHTAESNIRHLNVEHLLQAASLTDLDWFRKPERLQLSPFTTVLRLWVDYGGNELGNLLEPVLYDNFIVQRSTKRSAIEALKLGIQQSQAICPLWEFLDNCLMRFIQRPIKYESDLEELQSSGLTGPISLLTMVIVEQWPHFVQAQFKEEVAAVACWIARWLNACKQIGENETVLKLIQERLVANTPESALEQASQIKPVAFPEPVSRGDLAKHKNNGTSSPGDHSQFLIQPAQAADLSPIAASMNTRLAIPEHSDSYPELHRWTKKDTTSMVSDGDVAALLWCLSAPSLSIRRQSLSQLRLLATRVQESDYPEKSQLYLLLMEVIETATQADLVEALPSIVPALASAAVQVIDNPADEVYPKIMKWLLRAPEWEVGKIVSYWISKIFYTPPSGEKEGALGREMAWLCYVLLEGLRTGADADLFRRCRVWEHVMAKDLNSGMVKAGRQGDGLSEKVFDLLWRATLVEGGSITLVTRFGVLSWLKARGKEDDERWQALRRRIVESCDQERLETWSDGQIKSMLAREGDQAELSS